MRRREARAALERAAVRLDRLRLYPRPVRLEGVRIFTVPLFFALPRLRRYDGYAFRRTIFLRRPPARGASDDLICHELCHIWQQQHDPWRVFWAWLTKPYEENPYELEARRAVRATRAEPGPLEPPRASGSDPVEGLEGWGQTP